MTSTTTIVKPAYSDAPDYCGYYFDLVTTDNLITALEESREKSLELFADVSPEAADMRYAEGKWTLKQVIAHIIDCERVYAYRAMRFSRADNTHLPGFNEDMYAMNDNAANRDLQQIILEYAIVRKATILLFQQMNDAMLDFKGVANGYHATARAWGWMAAGHNIHHCNIIRDKYLTAVNLQATA